MFENFPYTNFHDLNLDWIVNRIMTAYGPDNPPPIGLVLSVNGETGAVVTYKDHIVQLPSVPENLWNIFRLIDNQANGIQFTKDGAAERIQGANRFKIYDEGNPPPGAVPPVSSVDGMTGAVKTWANTTSPDLMVPDASTGNSWAIFRLLANNDAMGISLKYDAVTQTYKAYLAYMPQGGTLTETELLTSASLPPSGVVSVNGQSGVVTLDGEDIAISAGAVQSIKDVTDALALALASKLAAPAQAGSQGQVLGLDANLLPVWLNQQAGQQLVPQMGNIVFNTGATGGQYSDLDNFYIIYGKVMLINISCQNTSAWASGQSLNVCNIPGQILGYGDAKGYHGTATIQTFSPSLAIYPTTMNVTSESGQVFIANNTGNTIPANSNIAGQVIVFLT